MTATRRTGIKKAVGDFNNWVGQARIYHDFVTGKTWTITYAGYNPSWTQHNDIYVKEVMQKSAFEGNKKTTMVELNDAIDMIASTEVV